MNIIFKAKRTEVQIGDCTYIYQLSYTHYCGAGTIIVALAVVVVVFLSSAPGLSPIRPSPPERRIQKTPRSRGDPGTYGGSNQRSLDCEASVLPLDHGSATALAVIISI
ncbi:hypothetical protein DPMN_036927 [Dreissena polymorpha]|uniref:Uncharacterized protein n=1 Tax=Dreissena polymorpha TaxID=45954 RepID=A0A9D4RPB6_DREPO|nr:hypothetical protein DPMN_036927 [Dreissena polymorpha]